MVRARPSVNGMVGSQPRVALARVMSGWRRTGSSCGSGRYSIAESDPGLLEHHRGELGDGELARIAEVDGAGDVVARLHHRDQAGDQVVDVLEGPRLLPLAVDRQRLPGECADDEVRDDAAVMRVHARAVRVEQADDLDPQVVLAVVVEEQRLGRALALVVAGAGADGIDVSPVVLGLGVHLRVAVHLGGRRREDLRPGALGQPEHVDRAVHRGLRRLHRVALVVDRRGGAGQVVDLVHLDVEREGHVVPDHLEPRVGQEVGDVVLGRRVVVVDAEHVIAVVEQSLAQVRADEARASGDQGPALGDRHDALLRRCLR